MWYVYIIRSISSPEQQYVGATTDLRRRLLDHDAGKSAHTSKFTPWQLVWYCAFSDKQIPLRPGICEQASVMLSSPDVLSIKDARNAHDH